jgi:hypothetical protein
MTSLLSKFSSLLRRNASSRQDLRTSGQRLLTVQDSSVLSEPIADQVSEGISPEVAKGYPNPLDVRHPVEKYYSADAVAEELLARWLDEHCC